MINLTGNYGHLGFITSVLSASLLSDWMVPRWLVVGLDAPPFLLFSLPCPTWLAFFLSLLLIAAGFAHFVFTLPPLFSSWQAQARLPLALTTFYRDRIQKLYIANPYGMFGAMQDYRWEVMVEGSYDGEHWRRYRFKWKSWDPSLPPVVVLPFGYWPRLEWHLWFLGVKSKTQYDTVMQIGINSKFVYLFQHIFTPHLISGDSSWLNPPAWYKRFLERLKAGDEHLLKLFAKNPFPKEPPTYLRTVLVDYKFAPPNSRQWWVATEVGT